MGACSCTQVVDERDPAVVDPIIEITQLAPAPDSNKAATPKGADTTPTEGTVQAGEKGGGGGGGRGGGGGICEEESLKEATAVKPVVLLSPTFS